MRIRTFIGPAVLLTLLIGCSTYSGQKLGKVGDKEIVPDGVPYNLVRPEYALSRTPPPAGQKDPIYTLAVTYQPDPTQRYSLKVRPGPFTNPDFVIKLTSTGTLGGTTTTFTEQLTPTITALGSLAGSVIGATGLLTALLDVEAVKRLEINGSACNMATDVPRLPTDTATTVGGVMKERIASYKDDKELMAKFHYVTQREKDCLQTTLDEIPQTDKLTLALWNGALKAYLANHRVDSEFAARLKAAAETKDEQELDAIKEVIKNDTDQGRQKDRAELFKAASPAATVLVKTKPLELFINMDGATWRARHLLYLEAEIERAELLRLRRPDMAANPDVNNFVEKTRQARAETIDALDLYGRAVTLSKFIETVRDKTDHGGKAPATAEYATARAELDNVLTQIEARRSRVIADAAPPAPAAITALQNEPVVRKTNADIEASQKPGWINGDGKNAKKYILVLEEVD